MVFDSSNAFAYYLFKSKYRFVNNLFLHIPNKIKFFLSYLFFIKIGYINIYKNFFYNANDEFVFAFNNFLKSAKHTAEHKIKCKKWFDYTAGTYQFYKDELPSNSIAIINEGFIQKIYNLIANDFDIHISQISDYVRLLPSIQLFIYIESTFDKCLHRRKGKHHPTRFKNNSTEEIKQYIIASLGLSEFIFSNFNNLPMKRISN